MREGTAAAHGVLTSAEVRSVIERAADLARPEGKKLLVLIPDLTRSGPTAELVRVLLETWGPRAKRLDFLIALGTHPHLGPEGIRKLIGFRPEELTERHPRSAVYNHEWREPSALERIGSLSAGEVAEISGGLLREGVEIAVNRRVVRDADAVLICGPVFPHEVVGFSGGNKYLFPGVSGDAFLQFFHWLGALLTNPRVNGVPETPVRALIDRAATLIPVPRMAFTYVVDGGRLAAIHFGSVEEAWRSAVETSRKRHIRFVDHPFRSILAEAPEMYDDLWTGGKCMYKLEPVLADAGELIILAPHIREVSHSHGSVLDEIGYHVRDYFTAQWEKFRRYPLGVVAHSTHVRGIGTFAEGVEKPRVRVVLATGIPEERCRRIGLEYRDPSSIRREEWMGRESDGILLVPHAGEILYRLKDAPAWARLDARTAEQGSS